MKMFLILLFPFVLLGCGAEPDAATEEALSAALAETDAAAQEALPAALPEQPPVLSEPPVTVVGILEEEPPILGVDLIEGTKLHPPEVVQTEAALTLYKVIKVVDGDTIDVLSDDEETIRLRFNGIDTPERGQPFGNNATKFVSDTVGGKMVRLVTHGEDKYDRTIADIYLAVDDPLVELPDLFLNRELVRRGLAWHYKEYSDDKRLADDEDNARSKKLGLWGGSHKVIWARVLATPDVSCHSANEHLARAW
ncbi:MAG: thermonuclease family protein [Fuerstiella sp.]